MGVEVFERGGVGSSWLREKGRFNNFDPERYRDPKNLKDLPRDIVTLFVEMDVMMFGDGGATVREMLLVPGEGFYHRVKDGWVKYSNFFEKAIGDSNDPDVIEQFGAEGDGWGVAETVLSNSEAQGLLIASPPGEIYRRKGVTPLSAIFVLNRKEERKVNMNGVSKMGVVFDAFSLYTKELPIEEHVDIVEEVGEWVSKIDELNPAAIVAAPLIMEWTVGNLNYLASKFGWESWESVESGVVDLDKILFDKPTEKHVRRKIILDLLSDVVRNYLREDSEFESEMVTSTIGFVMAKEGRGYYIGKSTEEIVQDVRLTLLKMHQEDDDKMIRKLVNLGVDPLTYYAWEREQETLIRDAMIQQLMSAHGGGGISILGKYGDFMSIDMRTGQYLGNRGEKKNSMVKCGCGRKIAREKLPCNCPNCGKKVSKGGM